LEGVSDFLSIPLGAVVSFGYDFTVLQSGQTVSNVQAETIPIPGSTQTETLPINVPQDLMPLTLPDDVNQTINNQFCFILQNNNGNYSLNVNALSDEEISNILQGNESNMTFMNISGNINENAWYHVTESTSGNEITANLYNTNGTLIESRVTPYNTMASNETIMLITNNVDSSVIFKDLTVKTLTSTQTPKSNEKTTNEGKLLLLYITLPILIIAVLIALLIFVKKKRPRSDKNTKIMLTQSLKGSRTPRVNHKTNLSLNLRIMGEQKRQINQNKLILKRKLEEYLSLKVWFSGILPRF